MANFVENKMESWIKLYDKIIKLLKSSLKPLKSLGVLLKSRELKIPPKKHAWGIPDDKMTNEL